MEPLGERKSGFVVTFPGLRRKRPHPGYNVLRFNGAVRNIS